MQTKKQKIEILTQKVKKCLNDSNNKCALKYYLEILNINILLHGRYNEKNSNLYLQIGNLYFNISDYMGAINTYEKALLCNNKALVVEVYNNLGAAYEKKFKYTESLKYYKKALVEIKDSNTSEIIFIQILKGLVSVQRILGQYNDALVCYKMLEDDYPQYLTFSTYNEIGLFYQDIKDFKNAIQYFQKSLQLIKQSSSRDNNDIAMLLHNIGSAHYDAGEYKEAYHYYLEAIKFGKCKQIKNTHCAIFYNDLGLYYQFIIKNFSKAEIFYRKALKIQNIISISNRQTSATIYHNIGLICSNKNKYTKALKYHHKALRIRKSFYKDVHPDIGLSYKNLGINFFKNGNNKLAYSNYKKSLQISLQNKQEIFRVSDNYQKQQYIKNEPSSFSTFFTISKKYLMKLKEKNKTEKIKIVLQEIYTLWLQEKGALQDEETFLGIIYNNTKNKALKDKIEDLKGLKYQYAKLLNNTIGTDQEKQKLELLNEDISKLEQYLTKHIQRFKQETEFDKLTYRNIAKDLKKDELFIDFAEGESNYYIFTLNKEGRLNFKEISKEDTQIIKESIKVFTKNTKQVIEDLEDDGEAMFDEPYFKESQQEAKEILSTLYDTLIVNYLKDEFNTYKKITISPDGLLNLLPFDALYDGEEYLLNKIDIYYISSGRELARINRFSINEKDTQDKITVFADPDYDYDKDAKQKDTKKQDDKDNLNQSSRSSRAVTKFGSVKPLKATKEEASSIQKIFQDHTQLYVEIEANEEHFRQTQDSNILHIATHGIVVENEEEKEPLLKTALALTGYNTSIKKKKDYGVLTGLKIANLNLEKTKLVVLSACETAVGQSDNVIGVSSLSRAFMIAGAKSTIASLWEVEDEGTKEFFEHFYNKIKTHKNYAEVFKETQRERYQKNKARKDHPLFWAGFAFFGSV